MPYLFTSESVSEGHPDKVADQISDALIDNFLAFDAASKVACETLVTTGQVVLAGEIIELGTEAGGRELAPEMELQREEAGREEQRDEEAELHRRRASEGGSRPA